MSNKKSTASRSNKTSRRKRRPPIRLACVGCDRNDYDGVWRIPKNWERVERHQTLAESYSEVPDSNGRGSAFDWFTHLGTLRLVLVFSLPTSHLTLVKLKPVTT